MNDAAKSQRVTVRMTGAMYANLLRLAAGERAVPGLVREAIRAYLDDRAELTGSRRYFTGRFREEVRALRRDLSWQLTLITLLLAEVLSVLVLNTLDLDAQTARAFTPSGILRLAEERLVESGWRVQARVAAAVDEAEMEALRREEAADG